MKFRTIIFVSALVLLYGCKPTIEDFNPVRGEADFTTFVVLGNSLSAGFADGALYTSAQENSASRIIARQLASVGNDGNFNIPYINTEQGVRFDFTSQGLYYSTKLVMGYKMDCLGVPSLSPVPAVENPNQQELQQLLFTSVADNGPFHNVSVPGVKISHLFAPGYGLLNPYYGRFAANTATDRLIDEPAKVNPTFFFFWVGSNDVLDYALSGGMSPITPVDGQLGVGFKATYNAAIQTMTTVAGKGVIGNIPDVTSIPYFKTIPYNAIVLTEQALVDQLNTAYAPYNTAMELYGLPYRINFALGANPMIIFDVDMPLPPEFAQFKFRQIEAGELVLLSLPQDSLKCAQWGTAKPVPNEFVLTRSELDKVVSTVDAFNDVILKAANDFDLALFDANSILHQINGNGIVKDGVVFTSTFVTGNTFSTDGLHLSAQGSAMMASLVIEAINGKYGSNIPQVNIADYEPILLP